MKNLKRIIAFCMIAAFTLAPITRASNNSYIYVSDNVEIEIIHSGLSEEKLLYIAQTLISQESNYETQAYGLTCALFGHKLVSTTNMVTTHMVYDTYPYCERKTYETDVCERCDYMDSELLLTEPVGCCVE